MPSRPTPSRGRSATRYDGAYGGAADDDPNALSWTLAWAAARERAVVARRRATPLPAAATSAAQMTTAARALLAMLGCRRAEGYVVRARRRRALALVERAGPSAPPPGLEARRLSNREQMLRVHDLLTRLAVEPGLSEGHRRHSPLPTTSTAVSKSPALRPTRARTRKRKRKASAPATTSSRSSATRAGTRAGVGSIQGHHLGASFTVADGRTSFLPMFVGATPLSRRGKRRDRVGPLWPKK